MGNSSLRRRRKRTKIFGDEYHVFFAEVLKDREGEGRKMEENGKVEE